MYCNKTLYKHIVGLIDVVNPIKARAWKFFKYFESVDFHFISRYYNENKWVLYELEKKIKSSWDDVLSVDITDAISSHVNKMLLWSFSSTNAQSLISNLNIWRIKSKDTRLKILDEDVLSNPLMLLKRVDKKAISTILENEDSLYKFLWINEVDHAKDVYNIKESVKIAAWITETTKLESFLKMIMWTKVYTWVGLATWLLWSTARAAYSVLMLTQIIWMPSEIRVLKKRWRFKLSDISMFREKYWILFSVEESKNKMFQLEHWPLSKVITTLNSLRKHAFPDVYNAIEVALDSYRKNLSVNAAFSVYPELARFDSVEDISNYLESLTPLKKEEMVSKINNYIYEFHTKQTSIEDIAWAWETILQEGWIPMVSKKIIYFMRSFFWTWWNWHVINWVNIVTDFIKWKWNIYAEYLRVLEEFWPEKASEAMSAMLVKNESFMIFLEKIVDAMHLWYFIERQDSDWSVSDVLKTWIQFSYWITWLLTTARWRELVNFVWELFAWAGDWFNNDDLRRAWIKRLEEFLNNTTRRAVVPKVWVAWISKYSTDKDVSNTLSYMLASASQAAAWFVYYYSNELEKWGYKLSLPKSNNALLMTILWNEYKEKYMWVSKSKRIELLIKDWDKHSSNWVSYHVPFIRDWNFAKFDNSKYIWEFMWKLDKDKWYTYLLHWVEPKGLNNDYYEYAYNLVAKFAKYATKKSDSVIRFEDLRKYYKYSSKDWKEFVDPAQQNKEDLFVNEMIRTLDNWTVDDLMNKFNNTLDTNKKAAIQMLWFLDAWSPWAGRELVAYSASKDFWEYIKKYWKKWMSDADKKDMYKNIRVELWKKYWNTLYSTDKNSFSNLLLFYAREKYPEYSEYISSPYNDSWDPTKTIRLVSPKEVINEDWSSYKYTNKLLQNMYLLDTYTKLAQADWDITANDMKSAFATIWLSSKKDDWDITYDNAMFQSVNDLFETLDSSALPWQRVNDIKKWILSMIGPKLKEYSKSEVERLKLWKVFDDTLHFLFDTAKKWKMVDDIIKDNVNTEKLEQYTYWDTTKYNNSSSWYYRKYWYINNSLSSSYKKEYALTKSMYTTFKDLKNYPFTFSKDYDGYNRYTSRYSKADYDYLKWFSTWRYKFYSWMRNYWNIKKKSSKLEKPTGYQFTQYAGYAVPKWAKKDLSFYEPTDRLSRRTVKRTISRKTVKYDAQKTRRDVSKWWIHNLFSKRGIWGSSVSRSKRRNTSWSKSKKRYS